MIPSTGSPDITSVACPFPVVFISIILSPGSRVRLSPVLPMNRSEPARQITNRWLGVGCCAPTQPGGMRKKMYFVACLGSVVKNGAAGGCVIEQPQIHFVTVAETITSLVRVHSGYW